jgi:uncharacterized protein YkwD
MRVRLMGETIARGHSPARVVRAWMNSPGHRRLLLEPGFRLVGVGARRGRVPGDRAVYVTADFARR